MRPRTLSIWLFLTLALVPVLPAAAQEARAPAFEIVLNLFPGFGLGSIIEKEYFSGFLLAGLEVSGWAFLIADFARSASMTSGQAGEFFLTGILLLGAAKSLGLIVPIIRHLAGGGTVSRPQAAGGGGETPAARIRPRLVFDPEGRAAAGLSLTIALQ